MGDFMTRIYQSRSVTLLSQSSIGLDEFCESDLEPTEIVEITPVLRDKFITEWEIDEDYDPRNCDAETVNLFE
jgi:hypothetical protein